MAVDISDRNWSFLLYVTGEDYRDNPGEITGAPAGGMCEDVKGMMMTKQRIGPEEEILRTIFDHIPVMINLFGPDGQLKRVNREWERTLGWSLSEVQNFGLEFLDLFFPDPKEAGRARDFIHQANGEWTEFRPRNREGRMVDTTWTVVHLSGGTCIGFGREITRQKQADEHFVKSSEQLRALGARLESLREEERIRIAREIHDELGQHLTALQLDLAWLERRLGKLGSSQQVDLILDRLFSAVELTDRVMRSVQEIAAELRAPVLDKLGLGAALQFEARRFQERSGIQCEVRLSDLEPDIEDETATALYRIFQECLTNVARHAQAGTVRISLTVEESNLVLQVHDNGRGISPSEIERPASLGILGMQERASLLGGGVLFKNEQGTSVIVTIPMASTHP